MKTLIFLCSFLSLAAFAIPESNYQAQWNSEVAPYFKNFKKSSFQNRDGHKISFRYFKLPGADKSVVLLPGRSEAGLKYAEVLYDLRSEKTNFFVLDPIGQGESDRLLQDRQKGYVDNFNNYVSDLAQFMNDVVLPQSKGQALHLLSHSMGGTIAAHYLAQYPNVFDKAVLSSPMMRVNTKPYSEAVATVLSRVLLLARQGTAYAPKRGPYVASEDTFETNDVTHSKVRFEFNKQRLLKYPKLIVAGPTVKWVQQSLKTTKGIDLLGKEITTPILLFQALEDQIVINDRQTSFCALAPDCQLIKFPGSGHEILQEKDALRDVAIARTRKFFGL